MIAQRKSLKQSLILLLRQIQNFSGIKFYFLLVMQFLGGFFENIGILTLLPMAYVALELNAPSDNKMFSAFKAFFLWVGIEPSFKILLFIFLILIFLKSLFNFLSSFLCQREVIKLSTQMRASLIQSFFASRWEFFTTVEPGKYGSILSGEIDKAVRAISAVFNLLNGLALAMLYVFSALMLSAPLTFLIFSLGFLCIFFLNPLVHKARTSSAKNSKSMNVMTSFLINTLYGMRSIKAMALEQRALDLLLKENREHEAALKQSNFLIVLLKNLQEPIVAVALVSTVLVSVYIMHIPIPNLAVFLVVLNRALLKLIDMQSIIQNFAVNEAGYLNVQAAIKEVSAFAESAAETALLPEGGLLSKAITTKDLTISAGDHIILETVNITIPARGLSLFWGPSGAGKTTFVDTIISLRDEYEGAIFYDDVNLRTLSRKTVRSHMGYVGQDVQLFHTTLRENILIAKPQATDFEIWEALKAAQADEFVRGLALQLDTQVGEAGALLSGGQRQRITLARALLRKPEILVLDEFTSALDDDNKSEIMKTVVQIARDSCVLLITHDQSIMKWVDRVFQVLNRKVTQIQ